MEGREFHGEHSDVAKRNRYKPQADGEALGGAQHRRCGCQATFQEAVFPYPELMQAG